MSRRTSGLSRGSDLNNLSSGWFSGLLVGSLDDGTWTISDGQSGSTGDGVSLTVSDDFSWFWTVSGESSDDFSDGE